MHKIINKSHNMVENKFFGYIVNQVARVVNNFQRFFIKSNNGCFNKILDNRFSYCNNSDNVDFIINQNLRNNDDKVREFKENSQQYKIAFDSCFSSNEENNDSNSPDSNFTYAGIGFIDYYINRIRNSKEKFNKGEEVIKKLDEAKKLSAKGKLIRIWHKSVKCGNEYEFEKFILICYVKRNSLVEIEHLVKRTGKSSKVIKTIDYDVLIKNPDILLSDNDIKKNEYDISIIPVIVCGFSFNGSLLELYKSYILKAYRIDKKTCEIIKYSTNSSSLKISDIAILFCEVEVNKGYCYEISMSGEYISLYDIYISGIETQKIYYLPVVFNGYKVDDYLKKTSNNMQFENLILYNEDIKKTHNKDLKIYKIDDNYCIFKSKQGAVVNENNNALELEQYIKTDVNIYYLKNTNLGIFSITVYPENKATIEDIDDYLLNSDNENSDICKFVKEYFDLFNDGITMTPLCRIEEANNYYLIDSIVDINNIEKIGYLPYYCKWILNYITSIEKCEIMKLNFNKEYVLSSKKINIIANEIEQKYSLAVLLEDINNFKTNRSRSEFDKLIKVLCIKDLFQKFEKFFYTFKELANSKREVLNIKRVCIIAFFSFLSAILSFIVTLKNLTNFDFAMLFKTNSIIKLVIVILIFFIVFKFLFIDE